jgi:type IV secretory pathway VirB4 component
VNVFDVSRLPQQEVGGSLRSALLSIMVANINQSIRRRRRAGDRAPILFFVDEMGILMRDPVVASYISAEYKTARARLVGMIVADQDLHSLLGPKDEHGIHHGVPMLANSATTLIFNQRDSEKAGIREHFPNLPEAIVDALPALPRGTCVSQFADGDLLVVSVQPSPLDRVVLSSRLQDRVAARKLMAQIEKERAQKR